MRYTRYTKFAVSLDKHPEIKATIPGRTYRRYRMGDVSRCVRLLIDHPELLETLRDEVRDASTSIYAEMPETIRSTERSDVVERCPTCHMPKEDPNAEACWHCEYKY